MTTNIFFTGATGYIGGSVLSRFLDRPDIDSINITILIRSPEKAPKFSAFGLNPVIGSHKDIDLVEKLASEADIVISMADSDYLPAIQAMLRGLEKRHKATGIVPVLIQTSGTGVLGDKAVGKYPSDTIYDDTNPEQIGTLAVTQQHRWVDVELDAADAKGYVKTYIVLPSAIYGIPSNNKFIELGLSNSWSIIIPRLVDAGLDRGQGGMVGAGKNLWNNIHIDDVVDLYLILYDAIKNNPDGIGHGREGYYFVENGTHSAYELTKTISEALVELAKGSSPEPTSFTQEEIDKYFGDFAYLTLGSNSRSTGKRSRALGWQPKYTTKDMLDGVRAEVEGVLRK